MTNIGRPPKRCQAMGNHIEHELQTVVGPSAQGGHNVPRSVEEQAGEDFPWPPVHQQERFDLVLRRLRENWVWMIAVGYLSVFCVAGLKLYVRYAVLQGIPSAMSFVSTADLLTTAATDVPTASGVLLFAVVLITSLFASTSRVAAGKLPIRMPLRLALKAIAMVTGLAVLPEFWALSRKCEAKVFVKPEATKPLAEQACIVGQLGRHTAIRDPYGVELVPTSEIVRIEWSRR